eukprot:TRINITY_DN67886_c0_g3_i2.p1 TRINITY_DN67886_c0_g3~~TRINITY_DN67886_c0_g3_i2.p1  ORF type:complete len:449 (+),score=33.36 TRINITY_DN67886_c0_g3_i2:738-2084(+)
MSLIDTVTDMAARTDELEINDLEKPVKVHLGILRAGRNVTQLIQANKILQSIFDDPKYSKYSLVVLGHSLGAGAAVIVSLLLRQWEYVVSKRIPLHCYAYSPPALMSKEGADFCKNFVTGVVLYKDLVPRLSYVALEKWKDNMLKALARCKRSKWSIIGPYLRQSASHLLFPLASNGPVAEDSAENWQKLYQEFTHHHNQMAKDDKLQQQLAEKIESAVFKPTIQKTPLSELPKRPPTKAEQAAQAEAAKASSSSGSPRHVDVAGVTLETNESSSSKLGTLPGEASTVRSTLTNTPPAKLVPDIGHRATQLFPPGQIVHMVKVQGEGRKRKEKYTAVWSEPDYFKEIATSPHMWQDHMPWRVFDELTRIADGMVVDRDHRPMQEQIPPSPFVPPPPPPECVPEIVHTAPSEPNMHRGAPHQWGTTTTPENTEEELNVCVAGEGKPVKD